VVCEIQQSLPRNGGPRNLTCHFRAPQLGPFFFWCNRGEIGEAVTSVRPMPYLGHWGEAGGGQTVPWCRWCEGCAATVGRVLLLIQSGKKYVNLKAGEKSRGYKSIVFALKTVEDQPSLIHGAEERLCGYFCSKKRLAISRARTPLMSLLMPGSFPSVLPSSNRLLAPSRRLSGAIKVLPPRFFPSAISHMLGGS